MATAFNVAATPADSRRAIARNALATLIPSLSQRRKHTATIRERNADLEIIERAISADRIIRGTQFKNSFFPTNTSFDIFLSHSHNDRSFAEAMASLMAFFGVSVFVDSLMWNSADELLRQIDDAVCDHEDTDSGRSYSYSDRNLSSSHVHAMLSVALAEIISACPIFIFLNTPNTISPEDTVGNDKTSSPWIYLELSLARVIHEQRGQRKIASEAIEILHDVDLGFMKDISARSILGLIDHGLRNRLDRQDKSVFISQLRGLSD